MALNKYLAIFLIIITVIFTLIILFKPRLSNDPMNNDYYIARSKIHEYGVFSKIESQINTKLFKAIANNRRITPTGAKVNHCWNPNTVLRQYDDGWWLVSSKNIKIGDEITTNYQYTPNFIAKPDPKWTC